MKRMLMVLYVLLSLNAVPGCSTFKPAQFDPATNRILTSVDVDAKDIKAYKLLQGINKVGFVYVKAYSNSNGDKFNGFIRNSLKSIGFRETVSEQELAQFVAKAGISKQIPSLSDLVSLSRLSAYTGPYLIVVAQLRYEGRGNRYKFDLAIVDPRSSRTLLKISRARIAWLSFDNEVIYPVINVVKRWYDECPKTADAPVVEQKQPKKFSM